MIMRTPEEEARLIEMHNSGMSVEAMLDHFNADETKPIGRTTFGIWVSNLRKQGKLISLAEVTKLRAKKRSEAYRHFSEKREARIVAAWQQRKSYDQIAADEGCDRGAVHRLIKMLKAQGRLPERVQVTTGPKRIDYTPQMDAMIISLRRLGLAYEQIGERLGKTKGAITSRVDVLRQQGHNIPKTHVVPPPQRNKKKGKPKPLEFGRKKPAKPVPINGSTEDAIAEFLAKNGVNRCPPAEAAGSRRGFWNWTPLT